MRGATRRATSHRRAKSRRGGPGPSRASARPKVASPNNHAKTRCPTKPAEGGAFPGSPPASGARAIIGAGHGGRARFASGGPAGQAGGGGGAGPGECGGFLLREFRTRLAMSSRPVRGQREPPASGRQGAAVHVANGWGPRGTLLLGVRKIAARSETKQAPLDKGRGASIHPPPRRSEGTRCITNCVDDGGSLVRDCGLNPQQFHNGAVRGHNFGWAHGAQDGGCGSPPRLAVRQDKRAGRVQHHKVRRAFRRNESLTNLTTAHVERALAFWNATACSTKRGALRHAAEIVGAHGFYPHAISQLAGHVGPFDLPQNTVRYLGRCTAMPTQVSSLAAFIEGRNCGRA
ncbi:hypothetical protein MOQ_001954, partial [Trypanosoma cruzi marinkellei]